MVYESACCVNSVRKSLTARHNTPYTVIHGMLLSVLFVLVLVMHLLPLEASFGNKHIVGMSHVEPNLHRMLVLPNV